MRRFLYEFRNRIAFLFGYSRKQRELDEEIDFHLQEAIDDYVRAGLSPKEARLKAVREFGHASSMCEECRDSWGIRVVTDLIRCIRVSGRSLKKSLGFTTTVIATLALCIGANVAMYAVIDAILVRALPYPQADRLVTSFNSFPGHGLDRLGVTLTNYYERRDALKSFESIAIYREDDAVVGELGSARRINGTLVSPEFFDTLDAPLALGRRTFTEEETLPGNASVAILSHALWQEQFNGESNALGQSLRIDGQSCLVVGVLAPEFHFLGGESGFFLPLASNPEDRQASGRYSGNNFGMIGRLRQGVTVESAQREVDSHNEMLMDGISKPQATDLKNAGYRSFVYYLHEDIVRQVRPVLLILQTGAFSLLLIGIVNLMNLFLIRAKSRAAETALRQSLGAGRLRIAREILIETLMLAFVGGGIGLAIGAVCIQFLDILGVDRLPLGADIALGSRALWISLLGTLCVGIALALPTVVMGFRSNLSPALKAESRSSAGSKGNQNARYLFIVTQVALAFALLSGAGMLGLSLRKALETSPGFQTEEVFTANLGLSWTKYPEPHHRQTFLSQLSADLRALPGVEHVGLTSALPFNGAPDDSTARVVGRILQPGETHLSHYIGFASGDYWQALGIPLIEGRFLEEVDNQGDLRPCVVDESLAQRYWPGQSAIGRHIKTGGNRNPMTIVGVVGTVKTLDLTESTPLGTIYLPYNLRPSGRLSLVVRSKMDAESLISSIRKTVQAIDPELPLDQPRFMQDRIDESLITRRSPAILAIIFASVALLLATGGTYGALAYVVSQRKREIGIRIALGALPSTVLKQFAGIGIRLLIAGLAIGAIGACFAGIGMKSALYEVAPFHPGILFATTAIMSVVVLFAISIPSNRAARVTPMEALRAE